MGRNEKPIAGSDPIGLFANRLRRRRDKVGKPPYRTMAAHSHYSHSVLADAAAGRRLPTWPVTKAFVQACGADVEEVRQWQRHWSETFQLVGNLRRRLTDPAALGRVVPMRPSGVALTRTSQLRPVQAALAGPEQYVPQPDSVKTYDDLVYQLNVLHIAAGRPPLRQVRRAADNLFGTSTLCEVLNGRRPPRYEMFTVLVQTLLALQHQSNSGLLSAWQQAWTRADFNQRRPDLFRRRRYGNLYLVTSQQDQGPTPDIIAEMPTEAAAALLVSLDKTIAGQIIGQMPPNRAGAVVTAMWGLTGGLAPGAPPIGTHRRLPVEALSQRPESQSRQATSGI
jgi:hypothetical protein